MNMMNLHTDLTEINADLSVISCPPMFRRRCSANDSVDYSLFLDEQRDTLDSLSITEKNKKWWLVSIDYYHGLQYHRFNSKENSQISTQIPTVLHWNITAECVQICGETITNFRET